MPNYVANLGDGLEATLACLTTSDKGLSSAEAASRLETSGPNETVRKSQGSIWSDLLGFFANPLVIILIFAGVLSASIGDPVGGGIIVAILLVSSALNIVQSSKSRVALKSLENIMSPVARAMRDGEWATVPRRSLVPGDIVQLKAGDLVPADCRLLSASDLHVSQASLTGESFPVLKNVVTESVKDIEPSEHNGAVFLGTSVVSGFGTAVVVLTGTQTGFGDIAYRLAKKVQPTEFERGLRHFGGLILRTVIFLVLFVFLTSIVMKRDPFQSLLFSVALAVGLTPEFLPMIVTITLSKGAAKMAEKGVIVKNVASMQNFGSIDILCTDKTGTLTTGVMVLDQFLDPIGGPGQLALEAAAINSQLQSGMENPLDTAVVSAHPVSDPPEKGGEIPFDFERRRMSVIVLNSDGSKLICKGAYESILSITCTALGRPLSDELRAKIDETYHTLAAQGLRLIAVGTRTVSSVIESKVSEERDLDLLGFLGFIDPPLPDAMETIDALEATGVQVKIISGDSDLVVLTVCGKVGLDPGQVVLGTQVEKISDAALGKVAEKTTVFARCSPAQKNRIITALRARGHVVGYMGDGINDAPSLHAADVGISVMGAAEVAKDAAAVVMSRPGLSALTDGILEGRRAFGNVMKYLLMGTSSNFGNMFSMAGAMMFLPFLPMLPTQILLNNFLYDLSQVTIPSDHVDDSFVRHPRHWDIKLIQNFMLVIGPVSSLFDFLTFWVLLKVLNASEKEFHTGWFVESLCTQVLVIFVIRTMGRPWHSRPSKPLALTVLAVLISALILPYTPLGTVIGFVPLPMVYFGFLVGATAFYLAMVEWLKGRLMSRALGA